MPGVAGKLGVDKLKELNRALGTDIDLGTPGAGETGRYGAYRATSPGPVVAQQRKYRAPQEIPHATDDLMQWLGGAERRLSVAEGLVRR